MFWIIFFLFLIVMYLLLKAYNTLQAKAEFIKSSLSNISVSLQKKVNLINQLIDVVKNYQDGEQLLHLTISKDVTKANEIVSGQRESQVALMGIQGLVQRYPDLKANEQYQSLMQSIKAVEDEIGHQRETFNHYVREYNTKRGSIPTVFIANALKFSEAPYLDFSVENTEQHILKDFHTDSAEHLTALLGSAKTSLLDGSKTLANKALDTSKRILESEQVQNLKESAVSKYQQMIDKPNQLEQNTEEEVSDTIVTEQTVQAQIDQRESGDEIQPSSKVD
ncbi:LemA family protein [Acinetobacter sp. TUM15131]|uniref:LemA family protein n=1 Tax=Acinetobacter sp. TUM15131 TaxID=2609141 RepID=UPI00124D0E5E|nr:LemA family protein [Acinetobacter sp. TUM15131]